MKFFYLGTIYLIFFFSGAAALIYQVVWVRAFSLAFGGTHLAVTTVLAVFMAGLALGAYIFGKIAARAKRPLNLYGKLELGIAALAVATFGLTKTYPTIYVFFAQGHDSDHLYLSFIRVLFATISLLGPTTLMGGTLPVLSQFITQKTSLVGQRLSFLYGFNTLGALAGTGIAGFYLLRTVGVNSTFTLAIGLNVLLGLLSILLQNPADKIFSSETEKPSMPGDIKASVSNEASCETVSAPTLSYKLVLWGIGISGFCALGYEVLWTRIMTLFIGATVYGFTTMLMAFLAGIALGSKAFGLIQNGLQSGRNVARREIFSFGLVQITIGVSALLVTFFLAHIPFYTQKLTAYFGPGSDLLSDFKVKFVLAFLYMLGPAFFMGMAFPLAGTVHVKYKKAVAQGVGEVLTYNTIGAILGAAVSGFVLIYLVGIEHSLMMLAAVNIFYGLLVTVSLGGKKVLNQGVAALGLGTIVFLGTDPSSVKMWDKKFFAIYQNNNPQIFQNKKKLKHVFNTTDVLYYDEGVEAIISVIKPMGSELQGVVVNGKVVASNSLFDQQCQLALGHLPMLMHPNPKKVLVVGLGTGMTLGSTSVHPSIEELTLVEIEPRTLPAARTFSLYNHNVLDNPKLHIVFNDGRNYLLTTSKTYDVITADPIHPWAQGASYLYTREYFSQAAQHLEPGGIMCQWLPLYEMSQADLQSVIKTFQSQFQYTMLWLTHYDAEIIGSQSPFILDEQELEQRIASRGLANDLAAVHMGTAAEFLSFFSMGNRGMKAYSDGGTINTDDNLFLEFSSPLSTGISALVPQNIARLNQFRENITTYMPENSAQGGRWSAWQNVTAAYDPKHVLWFADPRQSRSMIAQSMATLVQEFPWFGPGKTLNELVQEDIATDPKLVKRFDMSLTDPAGKSILVEFCAVLRPERDETFSILFVDNRARQILKQYKIDEGVQVPVIKTFAMEAVERVAAEYQGLLNAEGQAGLPVQTAMLERVDKIIETLAREYRARDEHFFAAED